MKKYFFLLFLLALTPLMAPALNQKPSTTSAAELSYEEFIESLPYMLFTHSTASAKTPSSGPNIYGCKLDLSNYDFCRALQGPFLEKAIYCPPMLFAATGQKDCDLEASDIYKFTDSKSTKMEFKVNNLPGAERLSFIFKFIAATEKIPEPTNLLLHGIAWKVGRVALASDFGKGQLTDVDGKILATFHLTYKIDASEDARWSGVVTCEPNEKCLPGKHSGTAEINFPSGNKIKKDFALKGEIKK